MAKHVHSRDPRKKQIVAALKAKSGGTKVTLVEETKDGTFRGLCMKRATKVEKTWYGANMLFERIGTFEVTAAECGL